jgi:hypothetical protein
MVRSKMRAVLFGATPQIKLPSSKRNKARRNVGLMGKYFSAFPHVDWKAAKVKKPADTYQATSLMVWN